MEKHQPRDQRSDAIPEFGRSSPTASKTPDDGPLQVRDMPSGPGTAGGNNEAEDLVLHDDDEAELDLPR